MLQSLNQRKLEIEGSESDFELFLELDKIKDNIIFIHPIISLFFDNLTIFKFLHNEILVPADRNFDFLKNIVINKIFSLKFETFKSYSLNFKILFDKKKLSYKCVSPEFGLIWILQNIDSLSVGIGLALLEFCDINILYKNRNLFCSDNILNLILELGETTLNRYDLIWQIIEKNKFEKQLRDFPIFLDRNIKLERRYDKILKK